MSNVLFNIDFLKENQRIKELCIVAKFLLESGDMANYSQVKEMIMILIIKEFGQTPVLYPGILADKLIFDSPSIGKEKSINNNSNQNPILPITPVSKVTSTVKDKDVITEADLDW